MKTRPLSRVALALSLLALGALSACEADAPFPSACSDTVCPGPSPLLTFAAQLIPGTPQAGSPIGQNLALTEVLPVVFGSSNGRAELRMRNPAVVKGTVEDAAGAPVPRARVTITLPSLIPGQSPTTQSATTDVRGEFSLAVPAAQDASKQTHRIWVSFDDPAQAREHPPLARAQQISNDVDLQLRLQQEATLSIVRGRVLDAQLRALPGARVQVQTASGDILSSTDISDEMGGYRLLLDQNLTAEDQVFLVAQPPQGGQAPVLLRRLKRPTGPADLVDINLQQPAYLPPQMVKLQLRGTGPSGPLDAVGARVQAQVQLGDDGALDVMGLGIYNASGDTDKDGAVTLPLLVLAKGQLQYSITVTSPVGSVLSSGVQQLGLDANIPSLVPLRLVTRPQVRGRIVAADGQPVAGAQVVARTIRTNMVAPARPLLTAATDSPLPQTQSDNDGRFALRVDPGDYDFDIVPPFGLQPRYSLDNQRVQSDMDDGEFRLPPLTLGHARVLGPEGYPVPKVNLRIFQLPTATPGLPPCVAAMPCSGAARLRAELSTDSNGLAHFLLPGVPSVTK